MEQILHKIRMVFGILRDLLIIANVVIMILFLLTAVTLIGTISQMASSGNLLPVIMGMVGGSGLIPGGLPSGGTTSPYGAIGQGKYPMDAKTMQLLQDVGNSFNAGDKEATISKLDTLEQHFKSKGMDDAAQITVDLKEAFVSDNMTQAQIKAQQLAALFGQSIG